MNTLQGEVLIFKALTDNADGDEDPYRTKLEEAGFRTLSVPVLDFVYCNLNELQQNIKNPSMFSGRYEHPLLFPCGNLKGDELSNKLSSKGVSVVAVTVYQTRVHEQLEQRLHEIILHNSGFPEIVVYFSPSGLKFTIPVLEKMEVPLHQLKLVAIGPTTEAAFLGYKLKARSVASKPTPEHLLEAVLKLRLVNKEQLLKTAVTVKLQDNQGI